MTFRSNAFLAIAAVLASLAAPLPVQAQAPAPAAQAAAVPAGPVYTVTYFETQPASVAKARGLLSAFARSSVKDSGNLRFIALERIGHPNHFAVLEAWVNEGERSAHGASAVTKGFREQLQPTLRSPYDERPHFSFVALAPKDLDSSAIFVVTHVDIIPTATQSGLDLAKSLVVASRDDPGVLAFDALQQTSRPNHVTLIETWKDQDAVERHGISKHMMDFRGQFLSLSGSLYDERIYKVIN